MGTNEEYKLFSKRRGNGEATVDVYQYNNLPRAFRNQVFFIWRDTIEYVSRTIGNFNSGYDPEERISLAFFEAVEDVLQREYGRLKLAEGATQCIRVVSFFSGADTEEALDVIELSFRLLPVFHRQRKERHYLDDLRLTPRQAVEELNHRFREHGIGYRFENGLLIRIDSEYLHAEAVQPALQLLHDSRFKGALSEFANAHEHFRHKRYAESLTDCLKAFESTIKSICNQHKWSYSETAQAKDLLKVVFDHHLIPDYLQSHYASIRSSLESGVPTVRNKEGAHGSGVEPRDVPEYLASYLLNLTATSILFLIRASDAYKSKKS